jgi:DNA-binding beta-propeller fold protein YncE
MNRIVIYVAFVLIASMSQRAIGQTYYAYAAAESEDEVALISFDGRDAVVAETIPVGVWPSEIEGPHGLAVSPDGQYWFVSIAHGQPYGTVYKYRTSDNSLVGSVTLDLFPATMDISVATGMLYVANFNLHGDMIPSTVSIVEPETMIELSRTTTGIMPHGSRLSSDGRKHYSVAMMSGQLYEMDAATFELENVLSLDPQPTHEGEDHEGDMSSGEMSMTKSTCSPTWAEPHPTLNLVYVACNKAKRVDEISLDDWSVTRSFMTEAGPYNIDVSPDGLQMVVTYKGANSTGIWNLAVGAESAVVPSTRRIPHGVVITPDSKFAFVTVEGVGSEPGTVDIIDLQAGVVVDSVDIGKQAGGVIFWKMER